MGVITTQYLEVHSDYILTGVVMSFIGWGFEKKSSLDNQSTVITPEKHIQELEDALIDYYYGESHEKLQFLLTHP